VTERAAAVYRRGCWLISNVSDVRIMWNITSFSVIPRLNSTTRSTKVDLVL
jgi:hypothetical protein